MAVLTKYLWPILMHTRFGLVLEAGDSCCPSHDETGKRERQMGGGERKRLLGFRKKRGAQEVASMQRSFLSIRRPSSEGVCVCTRVCFCLDTETEERASLPLPNQGVQKRKKGLNHDSSKLLLCLPGTHWFFFSFSRLISFVSSVTQAWGFFFPLLFISLECALPFASSPTSHLLILEKFLLPRPLLPLCNNNTSGSIGYPPISHSPLLFLSFLRDAHFKHKRREVFSPFYTNFVL